MKVYEFHFASASTASTKAPPQVSPPSKEPGWSIHSWQVVNVDVAQAKPAGPGMHAPATTGSTGVQFLVLWERDVDGPSDPAAASDPADQAESFGASDA